MLINGLVGFCQLVSSAEIDRPMGTCVCLVGVRKFLGDNIVFERVQVRSKACVVTANS